MPCLPQKRRTRSSSSERTTDREELHEEALYTPLSLTDIHHQIQQLFVRVPVIPDSKFLVESASAQDQYNNDELYQWAASLHLILEEHELLISCIGSATYNWMSRVRGSDEENHNILAHELVLSREQLRSQIRPRLHNILFSPSKLIRHQVVTERLHETVTKLYGYRPLCDDPRALELAYQTLAENASLVRQVVLSNLDRLLRAIQDYECAKLTSDDSN